MSEEMEKINKKHVIATIVIWGCIAIFAWVLFAPKKLELQALSLLPTPKELNIDISLLQFTKDFNPSGKVTLIFFGFTHCPDVCPVELEKMAQVVKKFEDENTGFSPAVVFVSVDPERDSLDSIKKYVEYFNPDFIGVTATNEALAVAANAFGAPYSRSVTIGEKEYLVEAGADMPKNSGDNYTVSHSSRIYVLDPMGRYIGSFPPPHNVDILTSDLKELLR